jgi:NADH:ubiquinone oxidoreductase subunit 6 (subunit J)
MSTDDTSELFEIKLNDRGIRFIRKFVTLVQIAILTGIVGSLIVFIIDLGRITNNTTDYTALDKWETAYFKSYPFFSLFLTGLFLVQLYYYWKLKEHLEEAINDKNELAFNQSFEALFKNAIWGLVLGVASLIVTVIDLFFWVNYY